MNKLGRVGRSATARLSAAAGRLRRPARGALTGWRDRRDRRATRPASRRSRRLATGLLVLLVALAGATLGLMLGGRTVTDVGPFNAEMRLTPSLVGDTTVAIPPLGSLHVNTHDGPAQLNLRLGALDQARTQELLADPNGVARATETVADDVVDGVIRAGLGGLGAAVLGAMLLAALVFRNARRVAVSGGLALMVMLGSLGVAAATFRISAVESPRYEGLLVYAPGLVGDVQRIADEYERYTQQLQHMVTNATILYTAVSDLPSLPSDGTMTQVLHVSDLHLNPSAWSIMRTIVEQYEIDVIIDSGDIVDWGSGPENGYLDSIRLMRVPYLYVRGNHDSEAMTQARVAEQPNATVLDDEVVTEAGLTIAGIGDPRFTPDQETGPHTEQEQARARLDVMNSGAQLGRTIDAHGDPVDIAVVHDPLAADTLAGAAPVVLAGHTHERTVTPLERYFAAEPEAAEEPDEEELARTVTDPSGTLLMVQGSTGGAGLRGLEGDAPEPLALSVLYYNDERRLVAYDDITVGGHGLSEVSVQRNILPLPTEEFDEPDPLDGTAPPTAPPAE